MALQALIVQKLIDIPPLWLALAIGCAWAQGRYMPLGPSLDSLYVRVVSGVLIVLGFLLIGLAVFAFWRSKTTVIPHQHPSQLVTNGVFALSRNPIYLGDTLILTGCILRFDAVLSLVLVPLFVWWIQTHFIYDEERRIEAQFGDAFRGCVQKVRRWM